MEVSTCPHGFICRRIPISTCQERNLLRFFWNSFWNWSSFRVSILSFIIFFNTNRSWRKTSFLTSSLFFAQWSRIFKSWELHHFEGWDAAEFQFQSCCQRKTFLFTQDIELFSSRPFIKGQWFFPKQKLLFWCTWAVIDYSVSRVFTSVPQYHLACTCYIVIRAVCEFCLYEKYFCEFVMHL